jgi:hypothetical protein
MRFFAVYLGIVGRHARARITDSGRDREEIYTRNGRELSTAAAWVGFVIGTFGLREDRNDGHKWEEKDEL